MRGWGGKGALTSGEDAQSERHRPAATELQLSPPGPLPRAPDSLANALFPLREKQQPAPRLTLRDLQSKSNCSSPSLGTTSLLHNTSPEPPGPPPQPAPTELSLANITVPLESIKPSEWE